MKHATTFLSLFLLAFAGCNEPAPVELLPPPGEVEITAIGAADTNYVAASVDSSAVLPADNVRFAAFLTVNRLTFDAGTDVRSGAYSRVLFEDRLRPVRILARRYGYQGVDLGTVTLNTQPMLRIPHRVRVRRPVIDTVVVAGVEYLLDLSATYQAGQTIAWSAPAPDSVNAFSFSITTPADITVQQPRGGSIVRSDRDLPLLWTGGGPVTIVVSGFDPATRRTRPLFVLRTRANNGSLVLPARVMRLLSRDRFRFYTFSFILANRDEQRVVGGFPGAVLVQAAAVYTTLVEIQ
jgi:hypothetical protein